MGYPTLVVVLGVALVDGIEELWVEPLEVLGSHRSDAAEVSV